MKRRKRKTTRTTPDGYLLSEHWQEVKNSFSDPEETCEICGSKHWRIMKNGKRKQVRIFITHHIHYRTLYNESRDDLQRLCKRCHDMCHKILRMKDDCNMVSELKETVGKYFSYQPTERKKK